MKKLCSILLPIMFSILLFSCTKKDDTADLIIGKWDLKSIVYKTVDSSGQVVSYGPPCENNQEVHEYRTDGTFTISYYSQAGPTFNYSISGDQLTRNNTTCTFSISGNTLITAVQSNGRTVEHRWERL
ncbi:MAG: hypothetical protein EOP49_14485 [Sphingobacteriales bacterium]|nr:MAG: hypothetical protein EOP49_14485 [Sphingobacteriales bacterium]